MGNTLQEILQTEYPLLDSSLLAAFISDLPPEADPSHKSFENLHHTLTQLSLDAQAESDDHTFSDLRDHSAVGSGERFGSENSASISIPDDMSPSASGASSTSTCATSVASCASALDFLHILFPHLSRAVLTQTLHGCVDPQAPPEEPDLSVVVDHLLTLEYIQDLADRGLEEEEKDVESGVWFTATARGKHGTPKSKTKPRAHTLTIPFVDIRQRQYVPRTPVTDPTSPPSSFSADPWTRLTSLATRLSELLQPTPAGFFMSYFHSPPTDDPNGNAIWRGEGDALRSALSVLAARATTPVDQNAVDAVCDVVLDPESHDIVLLDAEQRVRSVADARLCVTAALGDSTTAIDLMWLLRELDDAFLRGGGVAHVVERGAALGEGSRATTSAWTAASPHIRSPTFASPTHPPSAPPPILSQKDPPRALSGRKDRGWTLVEPRRPTPEKNPHPHADFIPAYANRNPRTRRHAKATGSRFRGGGNGDVGELQVHSVAWYKARAGETQTKRNEALREATRHWHGGNAKSRGGEVALYYAEKARELQEEQKKWALDAARVMVEEKRKTNSELDLHGLTVAEACIIVAETLAAKPPTPECPLKIITGRGHHSVGRVGVLGPAVHEMLRSERWRVGAWDGGLVVRGRM